MRKLAFAAFAAALAIPASPAGAEPSCRQLAPAGGTSVAHCTERRWEYVDHYARICVDKNVDGTPESCKLVPLFSIFS